MENYLDYRPREDNVTESETPCLSLGISEFNQSYFLPEFQTLGSKRLEVMSEIEAKLFLDHRNARN